MEYRRLGRTNLKVSILSIGGGAFFGPDKTVDKVSKIISYGVNNGINFIETAEEYDETKIGEALKNIGKDLIIASKSTSDDPESMKRSLENSIKKIGRHINIYMLQTIQTPHELETRMKNGTLDVLKEAKRKGLIDFIGITSHRAPTLIEAVKSGEFDVVEVSYSIGQTESEKLIQIAKDCDVGVIAIVPLAGGILIDRDGKNPTTSFMNARNALGYVISNRNVSTTLVGMSSFEHAEENISIVKGGLSFSEDERRDIEKKALEFLGPDFCRSCKACMPCDEFGWRFSIDNFLRFETFYIKYGLENFAKEYMKLALKADACTKCGKCEARCPYGIRIIERLKNAHETLSGGEKNALAGMKSDIKKNLEAMKSTIEFIKKVDSEGLGEKIRKFETITKDFEMRLENVENMTKKEMIRELVELNNGIDQSIEHLKEIGKSDDLMKKETRRNLEVVEGTMEFLKKFASKESKEKIKQFDNMISNFEGRLENLESIESGKELMREILSINGKIEECVQQLKQIRKNDTFVKSVEKIDELFSLISSIEKSKRKGEPNKEFNEKINKVYSEVISYFIKKKPESGKLVNIYNELKRLHQEIDSMYDPVEKDEKIYDFLGKVHKFYGALVEEN